MSSSSSHSPRNGSGWASPGHNAEYSDSTARTSPLDRYYSSSVNEKTTSWEFSKAMKNQSSRYSSFSKKKPGFFTQLYNNFTHNLLRINMQPQLGYVEKEKLARGRWTARGRFKLAQLNSFVRRIRRKTKIRLLIMLGFISLYILFYVTRKDSYEVG